MYVYVHPYGMDMTTKGRYERGLLVKIGEETKCI